MSAYDRPVSEDLRPTLLMQQHAAAVLPMHVSRVPTLWLIGMQVVVVVGIATNAGSFVPDTTLHLGQYWFVVTGLVRPRVTFTPSL